MNLFELIFAIGLCLFAIFIIGYLLFLILRPLIGDPRGLAEKFRIRNREALAKEADLMIEKSDWKEALRLIRNSFYFDNIKSDSALVEKISQHHMGLLSRLMIISDKQGRNLENLAIIEGLLMSRCEIMRAWFEAFSSHRKLVAKHSKKIPSWALDEYRNKIKELEDKLSVNQRSLKSQMDSAYKILSNKMMVEEVTYH